MSEANERLRRCVLNWGWPQPTSADVTAVLDELDALKEAHARLTTIYEARGRMVAAMRKLLDGCG